MNVALTDKDLYSRLREVLGRGWIDIPREYPGYGGTGAPGVILEQLLGIDGGNRDTPDAGKWEIKFRSGVALLTLFHLEAEPAGHLHQVVRKFGWRDDKGRMSFRHTIAGKTKRGFYVVNENERVIVRNDAADEAEHPYWTHDKLMNAFAAKFRRLIVVSGKRRKDVVRYDTAHLYWEPQITRFVDAVVKGVVAIDFDARTNNGKGLRNHGTKFRIKYEQLRHLYNHHEEFK